MLSKMFPKYLKEEIKQNLGEIARPPKVSLTSK